MRKVDMRMVTMREFRNTFADIKEPVRVIRARGQIQIVGTWTPQAKSEPPEAR